MPGVAADTQVIALDLEGVMVSAGAACSSGKVGPSHVLQAMGIQSDLAASTIRVSLGWNTREQDIDAALTSLNRLLARNADDASSYFRLPTNRVVEIGTQVIV